MSYTRANYKTKADLRRAVAAAKVPGTPRTTFPTIMQGLSVNGRDPAEAPDFTGTAHVEGPHYPAPHTWYAKVQVTNGIITKILG